MGKNLPTSYEGDPLRQRKGAGNHAAQLSASGGKKKETDVLVGRERKSSHCARIPRRGGRKKGGSPAAPSTFSGEGGKGGGGAGMTLPALFCS